MGILNLQPPHPTREKEDLFHRRLESLKNQREQELKKGSHKSSVVILGAGPAGLTRAIFSLLNGNDTIIIEKRKIESAGRNNVVSLNRSSIEIIKRLGIYDLLEKRGQISKRKGFLNVSLDNLEKAMKEIIEFLSPTPVIYYSSQLVKIIKPDENKVHLLIRVLDEEIEVKDVHLLVIAEGAHSITRDTILQHQPIQIEEKRTWFILNCERSSICRREKLKNITQLVYSHCLFLHQFFFRKQHFWNYKRDISFAAILKTPNQTQLGFVLTNEESNSLLKMKESNDYLKKVNQWGFLSLWFANYFLATGKLLHKSLAFLNFGFIHGKFAVQHFQSNIQRSPVSSGRINETIYLIVGDALATGDIVTGRGCNLAIFTSYFFQRLLKELERSFDIETLLLVYNASMKKHVDQFVKISLETKRFYRR